MEGEVASGNTFWTIQDDHIASCARCREGKVMLSQNSSPCDLMAVSNVEQLFRTANPATQGAMVSMILTMMRPMQLRCLAAKVAVMTRVDFIGRLAPELGLKVLQYLDAKSLCHAAQVARKWRCLADDDLLWHRMCEQHIDKKCKTCGWGLPIIRNSSANKRPSRTDSLTPAKPNVPSDELVVGKRKRADSDVGNVSDASSSSANGSSSSASSSGSMVVAVPVVPSKPAPKKRSWKSIYAERLLVERNWRKPKFHTIEVPAHVDGIMALQYNDCKSRYVTGGHDSFVRVWDANTNTCIKELSGHTQGVSGVQFDDNKIVTCSLDKTIRIWSMATFELMHTLHGHTDGVMCIHYSDKWLASGSADSLVRVWNLATMQHFTLHGHSDWVNKVQLYKKTQLFSCSDDCSVILWDLETHQQIRQFQGHYDQILGMSISLPRLKNATGASPKLVTASSDKTIKIWDVDTGTCLHTLFGHGDGVTCVASDTLRIVSGSQDNMLMVWDLESGKLMHSMGTDKPLTQGVINCCVVSDTKIMTGGDDGAVKIYNFYPENVYF
ncbi:WD40 repeat-like protein [Rhizoclosmatium globosum]|uniref:WD40 repeat-like protein n=1 Tax=Rhizoclosmatium globosum TaxID=329046 RepID=A0A1Y2CYD2_9FUNG|nr:WD40 repeat-like protein [Rhizoclosmatium globosum]|eukprot:ORY51906.1 WD40 repeat-like protein [Rhizoclosmatium globosum]